MRSGKIISLFFTLVQLIFFIKLVEYVQGTEISGGSSSTTVANFETLTATTSIRPSVERQSSGRHLSITTGSQTRKYRIPETAAKTRQNPVAAATPPGQGVQSKTEMESGETGKACAACEAGGCDTNPVSFGLPVLQLKVAVIVIVIWYIIFLKVWKYPLVKNPPKATQGYGVPAQSYGVGGYSSGGYGGYNGAVSNYNAVPAAMLSSNYGSNDDDSDSSFGIGSIFDKVVKAVDKFSS